MTGPAGVAIRSGNSDELAALAAVAEDAALALSEAGFPWHQGCVPLPRLTACYAEGLLWTAVDGADHLVGFVAATIADDNLHIVAVAVARSHQRRGIGRALMEQVVDHGRWVFFPAVTLTANAAVSFGAPFYRRLGFVALVPERLPPDLAAFSAPSAPPSGKPSGSPWPRCSKSFIGSAWSSRRNSLAGATRRLARLGLLASDACDVVPRQRPP